MNYTAGQIESINLKFEKIKSFKDLWEAPLPKDLSHSQQISCGQEWF